MRLDDPEVVRRERGLAGRKAAYQFAEGPDPRQLAFEAVAEANPGRVLDVGCGEGEFAERLQRELSAEVVALDQSERMVEITRRRGVDARVGDIQKLPFEDREFDCVVANWMLYHVADLDRGISELARALRPRGRLVAVTNSIEHLRELYEVLGAEPMASGFTAENGAAILGRHFSHVERRDAWGCIAFPSRGAAQAYVEASRSLAGFGDLPPLEGGLRVRRAPTVFVAEKA